MQKTPASEYSSYISRVIFDDSNELGDATHGVSNISQALNVWRESGLVGNEEPTAIELEFSDGKLIRWIFREDLAGEPGPAGGHRGG